MTQTEAGNVLVQLDLLCHVFAIVMGRACLGWPASPRRRLRGLWSRAKLDDCRVKQSFSSLDQLSPVDLQTPQNS